MVVVTVPMILVVGRVTAVVEVVVNTIWVLTMFALFPRTMIENVVPTGKEEVVVEVVTYPLAVK